MFVFKVHVWAREDEGDEDDDNDGGEGEMKQQRFTEAEFLIKYK